MRVVSLLGVLFLAAFLGGNSYAAEGARPAKVIKITSEGSIRPEFPGHQNLIFLRVNPGPWGSTDCNQDYAVLRKEENHMVSILLAGWAANKTMNFTVDSTRKLYSDICELVSFSIE